MTENPNGENKIEIDVPCCGEGRLNITFYTKENKPVAEVFKAIMTGLGVDVSYNEIMKGGGGP